MKKVTELTSEPVIGKFYLVPCIRHKIYGYAPVIGEPHGDAELGVPQQHYHYDVRFMSDTSLAIHTRLGADFYVYSDAEMLMGSVIGVMFDSPAIVWRRRECFRQMPDFPFMDNEKHTLFQKKYLGREVKCGRCPHRNMPLESLPQDENGVVICNGHGLVVSMRLNKVVERFK